MKVKDIYKFQDGGAMPADPTAAAPAEPSAPSQEEALMQIANQLVQALMQQVGDPQAVMAILQAAMDMVAQAAQPAAPTYQRQGGKLIRVS